MSPACPACLAGRLVLPSLALTLNVPHRFAASRSKPAKHRSTPRIRRLQPACDHLPRCTIGFHSAFENTAWKEIGT